MRKLIAILLLWGLTHTVLAASPGYEEKTFTNEYLGNVQFVVPKEWEVYDRHHINFGTTFLSPKQQGFEEFEISFNDAQHLSFKWSSEAQLREFIFQQMQQYVPRSLEKKVSLKSKSGANTVVYATLTDSSPKPGEFKLVTLGAARRGDAVFLIYQLTDNPALVDRLVGVVSSAKVLGK